MATVPTIPKGLTPQERVEFAQGTRCAYGPFGNRKTCACEWCQDWRTREAERLAAVECDRVAALVRQQYRRRRP